MDDAKRKVKQQRLRASVLTCGYFSPAVKSRHLETYTISAQFLNAYQRVYFCRVSILACLFLEYVPNRVYFVSILCTCLFVVFIFNTFQWFRVYFVSISWTSCLSLMKIDARVYFCRVYFSETTVKLHTKNRRENRRDPCVSIFQRQRK